MSDSDISAVVDKLAQTKVNVQHELSFAGKGLKLNTGDDGEFALFSSCSNNNTVFAKVFKV